MSDAFDLERFVQAQNASGTYEQRARRAAGRAQTRALDVVRAPPGRRAGPQPNRPEVCRVGPSRGACLPGPPRPRTPSRECARALDGLAETDPRQVLGGIDAVKLRSSMTLFERAAGDDLETAELFGRVLDHFFAGRRDDATLGILGAERTRARAATARDCRAGAEPARTAHPDAGPPTVARPRRSVSSPAS